MILESFSKKVGLISHQYQFLDQASVDIDLYVNMVYINNFKAFELSLDVQIMDEHKLVPFVTFHHSVF